MATDASLLEKESIGGNSRTDSAKFKASQSIAKSGSLGSSISQAGRRTVAIAGDSISANMTSYSAGNFDLISSHGWAGWGPALAGVQTKILTQSGSSFALGGLTTTTFIDKGYLSNLVAALPDVAAVMLGTNDAIGAENLPVTKANLVTIWNALINAGIYVLAFSVIPNSITGTANGYTQTQRANYIVALNNFIREWWLGKLGGEFIDCYSLMCDETQTNSPAKANVLSDLTHPTTLGGWYMGQAVQSALARLFPAVRLVASQNDYIVNNSMSNQLMQNPMLLGTGGFLANGASGVGPSNFNILGDNVGTGATLVASQGVANSGVGQKLILTINIGATGSGFIYVGSNDTITGRTTLGNILRGACRLRIKSGMSSSINSIRMYWQDGSINSSWNTSQDPAVLDINTAVDTDLILMTPETASVNLSTLSWALRVDFASAGNAVLELEQVELRDLSVSI